MRTLGLKGSMAQVDKALLIGNAIEAVEVRGTRITGHRLRLYCLAGTLMAVCASSLFVGSPSARADDTVCLEGISRDTTERLFVILNHPPAETDCKFVGVTTEGAHLDARWSRNGTLLPPIVSSGPRGRPLRRRLRWRPPPCLGARPPPARRR